MAPLSITTGNAPTLLRSNTDDVCDLTGCCGAYRAGLLYGLMNDFDWETVGSIASLMGSIKIAHNGTQNHAFTADDFADRF